MWVAIRHKDNTTTTLWYKDSIILSSDWNKGRTTNTLSMKRSMDAGTRSCSLGAPIHGLVEFHQRSLHLHIFIHTRPSPGAQSIHGRWGRETACYLYFWDVGLITFTRHEAEVCMQVGRQSPSQKWGGAGLKPSWLAAYHHTFQKRLWGKFQRV